MGYYQYRHLRLICRGTQGICDHIPLESEELQFVSQVMHLSFGQTPAGIGDDGSGPIITGLVEDGPKTGSTSISV